MHVRTWLFDFLTPHTDLLKTHEGQLFTPQREACIIDVKTSLSSQAGYETPTWLTQIATILHVQG